MKREVAKVEPVIVGNNSFIGLGAILLPGARIGDNVIVGAGSVVRGEVHNNRIVIGNPCRVIADTLEWAQKYRAGTELTDLVDAPSWHGSLK